MTPTGRSASSAAAALAALGAVLDPLVAAHAERRAQRWLMAHINEPAMVEQARRAAEARAQRLGTAQADAPADEYDAYSGAPFVEAEGEGASAEAEEDDSYSYYSYYEEGDTASKEVSALPSSKRAGEGRSSESYDYYAYYYSESEDEVEVGDGQDDAAEACAPHQAAPLEIGIDELGYEYYSDDGGVAP